MSLPAGLPGMHLPIRLLPCGACGLPRAVGIEDVFADCVEAAQR